MKRILSVIACVISGFAMSTPALADLQLATAKNCMACHSIDKKLVGPSYKDVAAKYAGQKDAADKLAAKVIKGGSGVWGPVPMNLEGHRDQPEWLSHVNASVLKVKLATAIIGISSIHLLKTFINADNYTDKVLIAQTVIHITFLLSAIAIAYTDKIMSGIAASKPH